MREFFKHLFQKQKNDIDSYQYKGAEDIILTCSVLRGYNRHDDAINLYEKHENEIENSDYEIVGLTTIIKICQESFDTPKMLKYANKLKNLAPDHPWIIELSKHQEF